MATLQVDSNAPNSNLPHQISFYSGLEIHWRLIHTPVLYGSIIEKFLKKFIKATMRGSIDSSKEVFKSNEIYTGFT